jgi:hypothetical protein
MNILLQMYIKFDMEIPALVFDELQHQELRSNAYELYEMDGVTSGQNYK